MFLLPDRTKGISDQESKIQVDTLESNCKEFGIKLFGMNDKRQGYCSYNWT
jgi:3-isopropylmalate/(R)-2-methylmalate dehydratase large subunit